MINQQLIDYIKQQLEQGASQEQIKNSLISNGWNDQDVENGFSAIDGQGVPQQHGAVTATGSGKTLKTVILVAVAAAVLGGVFYFTNQALSTKDSVGESGENPLAGTPEEGVGEEVGTSSDGIGQTSIDETTGEEDPIVVAEETPEQSFRRMQKEAALLGDNLISCTVFKDNFTHPLTGDVLVREIIGITDEGKCHYVEQMPEGGQMECKYPEDARIAVAQYYRDLSTAMSFSTSTEISEEDYITTYIIDGKAVNNPVQAASDAGHCVTSERSAESDS